MKIKCIIFILFLLFVKNSKAQIHIFSNSDSLKIIKKSFVLDTAIVPDYYTLEFSISEFYKQIGKGRRKKYVKINLDSIKYLVKEELLLLGFNGPIQLIHITDLNTYRENLFEATFKIKIDSISLVDSIFNRFQIRFKVNFKAMKLFPEVSPVSLENYKNSLEKLYVNKFMSEVLDSAKAENLKLLKYEVYQINLLKRYFENPYTRDEYGRINKFNISYSFPLYNFLIYVDFLLSK